MHCTYVSYSEHHQHLSPFHETPCYFLLSQMFAVLGHMQPAGLKSTEPNGTSDLYCREPLFP